MTGGRTLQGVRPPAIEWPTVALAGAIYGGWTALIVWHAALPEMAVAALGAILIAWHSSLQHELIHGHPTRWPWINHAIGLAPLSLWLPYSRYRETHLRHHRDEYLTDPLDDPETRYHELDAWCRLPWPVRLALSAQTTLLGRLVLGPAWSVGRFLGGEARAIAAGDRTLAGIWLRHLLGVAVVIAWISACGMNLWFYLLAIVYPGTSLLLIRSFAEHRAAARVAERTAIVENAPFFGVLFLYNNLHAAHHARPGLAWYKLPGWYRAHRAPLVAGNGGLVYDGYGDIFRRFFLHPHDTPCHPLGRASAIVPAPVASLGS